MIKSFKNDGLERFFLTGSKAGIQPAQEKKLRLQLETLHAAESAAGMKIPGWNLHPLQGDLKGHWSTKVNGNWRITFAFEGTDAVLVDYRDYH